MKSTSQILFSCLLVTLLICHSKTLLGQKNKGYRLEWTLENAKGQDAQTKAFENLADFYLENDFVLADSLRRRIESTAILFNKSNQTKLVLKQAQILEKTGNYKKYLEVMSYFNGFDYSKLKPKMKAEILANVGFIHTFKKDRRSSRSTLNLALLEAKSVRDFSQATNVLNLLAYEAMINKEKEKALNYTEQAIDYAKRSEDRKDLAFCFNTQAKLHRYYGENEISVRKNLLAFELVSQEKAYYELSRFAIEIGQLQEKVKNYSGAKYYYTISLENAKLINDRSQIGYAMSSIANILRLQKKYIESQKMNKAALKMVNPELEQIRLGDIEKNIGQNYTDINSTKQALAHFKKSIDHYEKAQNIGRTAEVFFLIGKIHFTENRIDEALEILLKSISVADDFGSQHAKFKTYPIVSEIYQKKGKKDLAIRYLSDYIAFSDNNNAKSTNNKIAELGEAFRSEENDRMLAEQAKILEKQTNIRQLTESKLENANLRSSLQTYFIIAFLIMLVLATVIGVYRTRQSAIQRKRKQAEMSQTLLRTQMNPHFIFNAMSVIQSYIYDNDVEKSSEFLVSFSRLIRLILENSPKEFISIETEIEILNKYLETQKLRFEKRFDFEIVCPENLIFEKTLIPPMITQPFVENSIEHGELHSRESGKIIVRFSKNDEMLNVQIEDNGVGRRKSEKNNSSKDHTSLATNITEERIRILNEKENSSGFLSVTDVDNEKGTGTNVLISLPFKKELSSNKN